MKRRRKTIFERIAQKNRLASFLFGPNAGRSTDAQKLRIVKVLFP